ncbi:actin-binding protein Coronin, containing WD40 repeat protein [Aspergillus oryzae 3.042]|uniref:Coronin n=1 Tax=Aspergillus oryzae (strain 3.042) TaxID=1160506 RepID=I8TLR0_ASPO3|nr:actin-binding protein Coronin, containing WD40 repeat protein [Aspergillus oryzae 3.042]|eukprot:EIT75120.1 actin-binding protein Coronin, containing WD40 repeat protein [Aspergillus oryzae 3.042]
MSGRFVRSSKYRHVFGRNTRKEQCYDNLRVSANAWDSNLVKVNPKYLSVNWAAGGGGAFAVIPLEVRGKLPEKIPLFRGHTAAVLDTDWNPFNDDLIASGSDDGKALLWRVPENFTLRPDVDLDHVQDIAPVGKLSGHPKKIGHVLFNPAAENVLATSSGDFTVKIWDIEAGAAKLTLNVGDMVYSQSWSANGSLLVTTSRDKKLRIWDARQERPAHEVQGHSGAKNSRVVWLGEHDRIATTGFSRMSDRQLALWDMRAPAEPINGFKVLDSISGVCMPFWDDGTQCLYLAGRGDGNIRYFELENDKFEYLAEYKSADPQRGIAFMPKRGVNMHENEVARAFKTVGDTYIEPISFIVPRRAETFQDDIYPPTVGLTPAMSPSEWFAGKEAIPPKISMASLYEGEGLKEITGVQDKPTETLGAPAAQAEPAPKPAEPTPVKKAPEPEPTPVHKPAPSMKEQGASMAAMVNKFADEEDAEPAAEESSFDEAPKPVEREARTVESASPVKTSAWHQREESRSQTASKPSTPVPAQNNDRSPAASTPVDTSSGFNIPEFTNTAASALHGEIQKLTHMVGPLLNEVHEQKQQIESLTKTIESLETNQEKQIQSLNEKIVALEARLS